METGKVYIRRVSSSTSDGEFDGTVWKVTQTLVERRKEEEGEWESTGVSLTVYDVSFEAAQQLAVGFLYSKIIEATEKSGLENPSLFDLDIENTGVEEINEQQST